MDREAGEMVGRVAKDAVAMAEERVVGSELLAVTVALVIEDADGEVRLVTNSWPERE